MKDNKVVFVIGCSTDLARPEIFNNLPEIMDNYTCIGLNRVPMVTRKLILPLSDGSTIDGIQRTCDWWYFQDACTVELYLEDFWKSGGRREQIVTFEANIRRLQNVKIRPHTVKQRDWNIKPTILLKPTAGPVTGNIFDSNHVIRKNGVPIHNCIQFRNSALAATNFAFLLGAEEVVHVGIDLDRYWCYPFGIAPMRKVPVKTSGYFTTCNEMFKRMQQVLGKIYKTNPSNALDIPYRSIVNYCNK